ncbi:polyneuridine-aldehyde esterase-like [Coffea eugenioides]|uniref:polyneuridine-aldehyde esterase-like n=1 Tax=Coffea eugenioides TaxID=49369 RepID=UPI000F60DF19|nr:polyneuridine-aldehyde esterase-like [Coffea eugenioides]
MDIAVNVKQQMHFILVHGAGHGAWCWYKLKPLLESAGQRVTAIDLSAAGINPKRLDELYTLEDYSLPLLELMASIPPTEKVVLVGHSYGGFNLALAMENYPEKISIAIFVTASMPDAIHPPSYPAEQFSAQYPEDLLLDTEISSYGTPEKPRKSMHFGPIFLSTKLYQLCSAEDLELAKMLARPAPNFLEDLAKAKPFSPERYGSVKRAYIVCKEDKIRPLDFQRWLIQNIEVTEVKEIKDADHMVMLSKPQELCQNLLEIASNYI